MPFKPGESGNPNGKPAGAVNKSTADARAAIAAFVDNNAERLQGWLDQIAEKDPQKAFDSVMAVCEYHIPKLQRKELTGKDGDKLIPDKIEFVLVRPETVPLIEDAASDT